MKEERYRSLKKIVKEKRFNYRCPRWAATKMLKEGLLKKHNLKSFQELADYLIVSGVIYLKPEIIEFLNKTVKKYKAKFAQQSMAKLGKAEAVEAESYMQLNCMFYEQDFLSFSNFCIENDVRPVWVIHSLVVDGFCGEVPVILKLIKDCQEKKIRSRKNTVARLVKDKYVDVLDQEACKSLLAHLTKKFDNKEFDGLIIDQMKIVNEDLEEKEEESELDRELNKKFAAIKSQRRLEINEAVEPVDFDENGLTEDEAELQ